MLGETFPGVVGRVQLRVCEDKSSFQRMQSLALSQEMSAMKQVVRSMLISKTDGSLEGHVYSAVQEFVPRGSPWSPVSSSQKGEGHKKHPSQQGRVQTSIS